MNNIDNILLRAEQHCQQLGARLTKKRKQVLSQLIQSNKALSAYELIKIYKECYNEKIPAMSAYRILDFLEGNRLVHKLDLANKYVAAENISTYDTHNPQQFLVCNSCSKVAKINLTPPTITELNQTVKNSGFELISPKIEVSCLCDNCKSITA